MESRRTHPAIDYDRSPFLILWELTRACALACSHCRASALRKRDPRELDFTECRQLLEQFEKFGKPLLVLTGGDPVWRPDLFQIIKEAKARGFSVAITPSATPRTTQSIVHEFKSSGIARVAVSMDGADHETHDSFRRVTGSFKWTNDIMRWAGEVDLPLQINTTIWKGNFHEFERIAELVGELKAVLWSVFFLVPTGRASNDMQIDAWQAETVLSKMASLSRNAKFDVKATAAPHFRRVLLESMKDQPASSVDPALESISPDMKLGSLRAYQSVNDGKGILFVSHTGDVYPSGFLPLSAGNVRDYSVSDVYRMHPMFRSLRDPNALRGKCGRCRFKAVCGGSRARAFAITGDYLSEDDLCAYSEPEKAE